MAENQSPRWNHELVFVLGFSNLLHRFFLEQPSSLSLNPINRCSTTSSLGDNRFSHCDESPESGEWNKERRGRTAGRESIGCVKLDLRPTRRGINHTPALLMLPHLNDWAVVKLLSPGTIYPSYVAFFRPLQKAPDTVI